MTGGLTRHGEAMIAEAMREYDRTHPLPADRHGPGWPKRYGFLPAAVALDRLALRWRRRRRRIRRWVLREVTVDRGQLIGFGLLGAGLALPWSIRGHLLVWAGTALVFWRRR